MNSFKFFPTSKSTAHLPAKAKKRPFAFSIDKRQKFVVGIILLSLGLFFGGYQFKQLGFIIAFLLSAFTILFLFWAIRQDLRESKAYQVFILPFFYSLAFTFFYFLTPAAFVTRLLLTFLYAFGLYSLFLSQNIFIVSSLRTIQLLSGARIVSFVLTLLSFFFLTNTLFTFHVIIFPVIVLMLLYTYALIYHSLWIYNLQKTQSLTIWVYTLTVCLIEAATLVWFWPTNPTVIALFLTGFLYVLVGLAHIWFERRLFKGVLWEYVWVGCIVFFVLVSFTQWGK